MTLQASGVISMSDVNIELGASGSTGRSLNDTSVRTLFAKPSGTISLNDGYGKSNRTYAVLNPSDKGANLSLSNGNLTVATSGGANMVRATQGKSSGKWYWEVYINSMPTGQIIMGVAKAAASLSTYPGQQVYDATYGVMSYGYSSGEAVSGVGYRYVQGGPVRVGSGYGTGNTVGFHLDMDAKTLQVYVNGVSQCPFSSLDVSTGYGTFFPAIGLITAGDYVTANFGASAFNYSVPSGFNPGVYV